MSAKASSFDLAEGNYLEIGANAPMEQPMSIELVGRLLHEPSVSPAAISIGRIAEERPPRSEGRAHLYFVLAFDRLCKGRQDEGADDSPAFVLQEPRIAREEQSCRKDAFR